MEEKLDPIYAKYLLTCAKVNEVWCDPWEMGTSYWQENRDKREQTAWIISEYLEEEMRKYRQLWTESQSIGRIIYRSEHLIIINDGSEWRPILNARPPWYERIFKK